MIKIYCLNSSAKYWVQNGTGSCDYEKGFLITDEAECRSAFSFILKLVSKKGAQSLHGSGRTLSKSLPKSLPKSLSKSLL